MIAAIAAADKRHVAEAARRQIADHRAFAFEQRVGGDRRTEADRADLVGGAERLEASHHAFDRILRRRQILPRFQFAIGFVEGDKVREGSTDIDAKAILHVFKL